VPYINNYYKKKFEPLVDSLEVTLPGVLNFVITKICHNYIKHKGLRYATLNEIIGVLESAKMELYRQVVGPYESKKKSLNGNISKLDKE